MKAYSSEVMLELLLRPSARAAPPLGPSSLRASLHGRVQEEWMLRSAARKANTSGLHVPERSNSAPFESIAELVDAISSVGAFARLVDAAEGILIETATRKCRCQGALTAKQTLCGKHT